jgi:hypothetical protein
MRICSKCKIEKPPTEFYKSKQDKDGCARYCKNCNSTYNKKRHFNLSSAKKLSIQELAYQRKCFSFGISKEEYDRKFEEQHGLCAICKQPEQRRSINGKICRLSLDHNHKTKEARGLLCSDCNVAIGLMREDKLILLNAIKYIESYEFSK